MESGRRQARESRLDRLTQEELLEAECVALDKQAMAWRRAAVDAVDADQDDFAREALRRKRSAGRVPSSTGPI